jgi:hypothetical protein
MPEACLGLGRMGDCTSASWAARWKNVHGISDYGTDLDSTSLSLQVPESGIGRVRVLAVYDRAFEFEHIHYKG